MLSAAIAFTSCSKSDGDSESPNVTGETLKKTTHTIAVGD